MLPPEVRGALRTVGAGGAPEVSGHFESSCPGLFLAGLLTAPAYGPAMRFVYGAAYTAERLVRGVERRLGAARRPATVPGSRSGTRPSGAGTPVRG